MWSVRLCVVCVCMCVFVYSSSAQDNSHTTINQLAVDQRGSTDTPSLSYCRLPTRDLITTAHNTATRVLKGICNPRELSNRFQTLERQMGEDLSVLKTMLMNIENHLRTQEHHTRQTYATLRKEIRMLSGFNRATTGEPDADSFPDDDLRDTDYHGKENEYVEEEEEEEEEEEQEGSEQASSTRDHEIDRFNSTLHQENGERVFTYYWRVSEVAAKMDAWGMRRSLRSSSFYIFQGGYRMYLRVFPNKDGRNFYVHVGLTKGDFDSRLEWPFSLRHQVRILDHSSPPDDLVSRLWDPSQLCSEWHWDKPSRGDNYECVGLGFSKATLHSRNYILNDSVVIKLTVLLSF